MAKSQFEWLSFVSFYPPPPCNSFSSDIFSELHAFKFDATNCLVSQIERFLKGLTDCCNSQNASARSEKLVFVCCAGVKNDNAMNSICRLDFKYGNLLLILSWVSFRSQDNANSKTRMPLNRDFRKL